MCNDCGCALSGEEPLAASMRPASVSPVPSEASVQSDRVHAEPPLQGAQTVQVLQRLLAANDEAAAHNRAHLDAHGILAVNLMSSPGAGKTALLEATIDALAGRVRIGVIEGDLETENDAVRIRAHGVPAVQITTGTACHLDAHLVHRALHHLPLDDIELLFIENVGNLVCPAAFELGTHRNVVLLSVTEGDDKPSKYPVMFRAADLVMLSKTDLLPLLEDFEPRRAEAALRALGRDTPLIRTAVRREVTLDPWLAWLESALSARRVQPSTAEQVRSAQQLPHPQGFHPVPGHEHVHHRHDSGRHTHGASEL